MRKWVLNESEAEMVGDRDFYAEVYPDFDGYMGYTVLLGGSFSFYFHSRTMKECMRVAQAQLYWREQHRDA